MNTFAERLRERMFQVGLTQEKLAERVGLSQAMIQKYTSGQSKKTSRILDLAEALECTPEWLEKGVGEISTTVDRIHKRMAELKLKSVDIVELTGASKGAVSNWVNGSTEPSGTNLLKLSKVLKCTPDWLITGKEKTESNANFITNNPAPSSYIESLLSKATPKSSRQIIKIAQAASEGRLTEADIELISSIAERFEQPKVPNQSAKNIRKKL